VIGLIRHLVFHDFWLKLFSLVLAVLTWLTVTFNSQRDPSGISAFSAPVPERTLFNLHVVVMSSAEDVRNFKVIPNEVAVTVQGEARSLATLQAKDIRVLVDLTGMQATGNVTRRIEVSTPTGITHAQVIPPEVRVIFPAKN
jgi:hypothetical protein